MRKTTFRYVTIFSEESNPDVIYGVYAPQLNITLSIAEELVENRLTFCNHKPKYAILDFSNVKSIAKEACQYINSPNGGLQGLLGGAFVSNKVVATLLINLFLKLYKPPIPARFFTNPGDALKWILKLKSDSVTNQIIKHAAA